MLQLITSMHRYSDVNAYTHTRRQTHSSPHERLFIGVVKALLWNVSEARWSTDPQQQTGSFLLLQTQVLSGLQRIAPLGLRGYIFLTFKATAAKAPQESPFRVKGGKPFNSRAASGFWSVHKLQFCRGPFFHANGKPSNTVRKCITFGYTVIGPAFNMGTFTAKDLLESLLRVVKSTLGAQV